MIAAIHHPLKHSGFQECISKIFLKVPRRTQEERGGKRGLSGFGPGSPRVGSRAAGRPEPRCVGVCWQTLLCLFLAQAQPRPSHPSRASCPLPKCALDLGNQTTAVTTRDGWWFVFLIQICFEGMAGSGPRPVLSDRYLRAVARGFKYTLDYRNVSQDLRIFC